MNKVKRFDAVVDSTRLENKGGWIIPKTTRKDTHVYALDEKQAMLLLKTLGYKNIEMKGQEHAESEQITQVSETDTVL